MAQPIKRDDGSRLSGMKDIHYLVAFITLNHMAMAAARVGVPLYAIHMKASPAVVGVLVGLFAIVPTLLSVPIGRMVDRIGTRGPLVAFMLVILAGLMLPFLWADAMLPLYAVGLLVGGGYFALFIVHTALGGWYGRPEERAGNFAQISLGFAAANGLGPLLAGLAIDHAGYRNMFVMLALLVVAAFAIFLAGRLPQRGPAEARRAAAKRSVMDLLRSDRMRPVYAISIYFMLLWDIFMVMTPIYGAELEISASEIGIVMGTFSAASFMVRVFVTPLSRRFTPLQLLLISQAAGALAMLGFGFASTTPFLIAAAFALGAGQGLGGPMVTTALYEAAPPDRVSEASGLRMSVGMACQAFLPLLTGAAAAFMGVAPLLWLTAAVLGFGVWQYRGQWNVDLRSTTSEQNKLSK